MEAKEPHTAEQADHVQETAHAVENLQEENKNIVSEVLSDILKSIRSDARAEVETLAGSASTRDFTYDLQEDDLSFLLSLRKGPPTPPPTPVSHMGEDSAGTIGFEMDYLRLMGAMSSESQEMYGSLSMSLSKTVFKRTGFKIDSSTSDGLTSDSGSSERIEWSRRASEQRRIAQQRAECNRFAGVENFATSFVDEVLDKSMNDIKNMYTLADFTQNEEDSIVLRDVDVKPCEKWPRIQDFSREIGESAINEYMSTWEYNENWLYCIDLLSEESDECSDYYIYEAKWSIPSNPYPIPQATASVYFTIEVSRIKPSFCPVEVTYMFEGQRLVHIPGKIAFREQWLFNIIDAKLNLYRQIMF